MSADVHEKFVFKEEQSLFRYCEGNLSFSATSNNDDYNYNKKKISRDPMSHRIIEKRRRDRMNNCLADLSRLIPPEYLKKGRGRIEKTEIIEMAIKHMRHLQNIIASTTRFSENSDNSVPSPPATSAAARDSSVVAGERPITVEHYRLGYLECLSEAMRFLVEVQGYFAGDSLCVQMINHLHKHCDKILKGNTLNFPKKHAGETTSSDSSASPANGTFNNSPPLGMSNSTGSVASDDNQLNQNFDSGKQSENPSGSFRHGHRSPRRYSDASYSPKKNSDACYPRHAESEGIDAENRSDFEDQQNYGLKCRNNGIRKDDSKSYLNNYETAVNNFGPRNYSISNGIFSNAEDSGSFENASLKEENVNGTSQLREMLTSPLSVCAQLTGHSNRCATDAKGNASPASNTSGCESSPGHPQCGKPSASKSLGFKSDASEGNFPDFSESLPPDNHHMMYKFKNNIKQRFSKEKRENPECDVNVDANSKKQKSDEDYLKYPDPLMKERLNFLDKMEADEEKVFKFNVEMKKRSRYSSESEVQDGEISNRLGFGHKSIEKVKRWEETVPGFPYQNASKLWSSSPNASVPFFNAQPGPGCKAPGRQVPEYSSAMSHSFNDLSISAADSHPGIPIFALHAKGSFYIPLTLDHVTLAPFLAVLGIAKTDESHSVR